jgi:excisionase family DNA binding protein
MDSSHTSNSSSADKPKRMEKAALTITQAAEYLHVSEKTIYRKLKSGNLKGRKTEGRFGPEWLIELPET